MEGEQPGEREYFQRNSDLTSFRVYLFLKTNFLGFGFFSSLLVFKTESCFLMDFLNTEFSF